MAGRNTTSLDVVSGYVRQKAMIMTKTIGAEGARRGLANRRVSNNDASHAEIGNSQSRPTIYNKNFTFFS